MPKQVLMPFLKFPKGDECVHKQFIPFLLLKE